eukprot:COSAG06_NODE_3980_length_4692_cov_4.531679_3_plen_42_part_00
MQSGNRAPRIARRTISSGTNTVRLRLDAATKCRVFSRAPCM